MKFGDLIGCAGGNEFRLIEEAKTTLMRYSNLVALNLFLGLVFSLCPLFAHAEESPLSGPQEPVSLSALVGQAEEQLQDGRDQEAHESLQRVLALEPRHERALALLGVAEIRSERPSAALSLFMELPLSSLDEFDYWIGRTHQALGNSRPALDHLLKGFQNRNTLPGFLKPPRTTAKEPEWTGASESVTITLIWDNDAPHVDALLDGNVPVRMLLDTGGVESIVSWDRFCHQTTLDPIEQPMSVQGVGSLGLMQGFRIQAASFSVGAARWSPAPVQSYLLPKQAGYQMRRAVPLQGMLAPDLLRLRVMEIDWIRRTLTLSDPDRAKGGEGWGEAVHLKWINRHPHVEVFWNGRREWMLVDTGFAGNLMMIPGSTAGLSVRQTPWGSYTRADVMLGPVVLTGVVAEVRNLRSSVVGRGLLKAVRLVWDFPHDKAWISAVGGMEWKAIPEVLTDEGNLAYAEGRVEDAIAHHTRALELDPTYVRAAEQLGSLYEAERRWEEAIGTYARWAGRLSTRALPLYRQAEVYLKQKSRAKAIAVLKEALFRDPGHLASQKLLRSLE